MKEKRPIFLDLTKISFPIPAIISIMHRLSGVGLFLLVPIMLSAFQGSLASREQFLEIKALLSVLWIKCFLWMALLALLYHLVAGLRHMVMDFGFWEGRLSARRTAIGVLVVTGIFCLLVGAWLW